MNHVLLIVGDDEYRLKATTQAKVEAEQRLGTSLLRALEHIDRAENFATILWAAMQKLNHGMRMSDCYDLIDKMEEQGCEWNGKKCETLAITEKTQLALDILKVSGYFTKDEIAKMEKEEQEEAAREAELKALAEQSRPTPKKTQKAQPSS